MSWLFIAILSYFLSALVIILDKFILTGKKISSPPVYSFYIALLGLFSVVFIPFSFAVPPADEIMASLFSGGLFTFGILALYFAIREGQASRVVTFTGAVIPFFTFVVSKLFFGENLELNEIIGAILLVGGGLLVTFDLPFKTNQEKFWIKFKYALLAGILLAVAYSVFKHIYNQQAFLNGFIWTRFGSALAAAGLFLVPSWRKDILRSLRGFRRPSRENYHCGALIILNKVMGGTASILFNYAIKLGSVTIINALVASQYVFILIFAVFFSKLRPDIFQEKLSFWDWTQKIVAIFAIAAGICLVAGSANPVSF